MEKDNIETQNLTTERSQSTIPSSSVSDFASAINDSSHGTLLATRAVKLPPFWKDNCALWFVQVEAALEIAQIRSDISQYRYVLVHLDETTLPFVADIITSPPVDGKFLALKTRLLNTFEESGESKLRRLLHNTEFTDGKPSHYLLRLKSLAAGMVTENILRTIFLEQMPQNVRSILAVNDTSGLDHLAVQADKIFEVQNRIMFVSAKTVNDAVTGTESPKTPSFGMDELSAQLQALTTAVNKNNNDRAKEVTKDVCYYHTRFGAQAKKCRQPCSFRKNTNLN
ncbi:uncharacterized protein LOC118736018 [Rhagoletis pomonella]|uniref:uncharacterized protein LOC118736018 n=1 Tax=Rhagoletis pomonella TaxID=28610 RepID=UPI00177E1B84|nr:uncharacterized protein LOC118736018 [Rhagoletis pomonella]